MLQEMELNLMSNKPKRPVISDNDLIFATMSPKEASEFTGGYDKEKIKFMREVKNKLHAQERFDAARKVEKRKDADAHYIKDDRGNSTGAFKNFVKEKPYYMTNLATGGLENVNAEPVVKKPRDILDYVTDMQKMYGGDDNA